jgi:hypothetical protein
MKINPCFIAKAICRVAGFATFRQIVAEWRGGKHGSSHRIANFAPHNAAANTRAVTVLAQTRRLRRRLALLRHFRLLHGGSLSHSCRLLFIAPFAQGALWHASIAAGGDDIAFKIRQQFENEIFVIKGITSGHAKVSNCRLTVIRKSARQKQS